MKRLIDVFNDENLFKEATTFNEPVDKMPGRKGEFSYQISPREIEYEKKKGGSFLGITPTAILGTALGFKFGLDKGKKDTLKQIQQSNVNKFNNVKPVIDGNYYQQANNVLENLGVVFTPFGTVYTLKNKNKNVAIDTIETGEMNKDMKYAWKQKDENYFRGLMLSKMYSEMQLAEQGFAKQVLEMQQNGTDKKASEDYYDICDLNTAELIMKCATILNDLTDLEEEVILDKIASIENYVSDMEDIQFELSLDRPFDKYAGFFGGIKSSLGFGESNDSLKTIKKKLSNPQYLKSNLNVGFMPDRVIFTVDNTLISTLSLKDMNKDGYDNFLNSNSKYFKNLFVQEMKKGIEGDSFSMKESNHLEKSASIMVEPIPNISDIFTKSSIHPVIYFLALSKSFKDEWFNYDPMALIKIIEVEFKLTEPICDSALDKILSIQVANNSQSAYTTAHAFEKVVRAFNNKPIDFLEKEDDDLDIDDFVFAIDVLNRVTPHDDIYDNFSTEVIDYMCKVLAEKETRCYAPTHVAFSPLEPSFQEIVNDILLTATNRVTTDDIENESIEEDIKKKNSYIHDMSLSVTKAVRRALENKDVNVGGVIDEMISRIGVSEELRLMVKREVFKNLTLDEALKEKEDILFEQLNKYGLGGTDING